MSHNNEATKSRRPSDEECYRLLIRRSLAYEVEMLGATYQALKVPNKDSFQTNVLLESFALHARNIFEFLLGSKRDKYAKVNDITEGYEAKNVEEISHRHNNLYIKINNQIAHLSLRGRSFERSEKIQHQRDTQKIFEALSKDLCNVQHCILSKYKVDWESVNWQGLLNLQNTVYRREQKHDERFLNCGDQTTQATATNHIMSSDDI